MNLGTYRECVKARQQMQTLLDTSFTTSLPQDLEVHLEHCTACREMWRLALHYEDLLRIGRAQIPDAGDLLPAFHRRLEAEPPATRKRGFYLGKSPVFLKGMGVRRLRLLGFGGATVATLALLWMAARTLFLPGVRSTSAVVPPEASRQSGTRRLALRSKSRAVVLQAPLLARGAVKLMKPPMGQKESAASNGLQEKPQIALRVALPKASADFLETPTSALRGIMFYARVSPEEQGILPQKIGGFSADLSAILKGEGDGLESVMLSEPAGAVRMGSFGDQSLLKDSMGVLEKGRHTSATLIARGFAAPDAIQEPTEEARATNQSQEPITDEPSAGQAEMPIRLHVVDPRRGFTGTLQVVPAASAGGSTPIISLQEAPMPKTEGGQP